MALIPAFSIIAAVTSGFLSKCCPSEWWSSTPAWRYGAAAWRCSGFFSRPTLGMSELAYTISVRRQTARAQVERCHGQPAVHSWLCASLKTVQVSEGGRRTKGEELLQRPLSLPSSLTRVTVVTRKP